MLTKNDRQLNAKSRQCRVISFTPNGVYRIKSPSGKTYTVDLGLGGTCTCAWGRKGGAGCSHERAARRHWAEMHEGRAVSFMAGEPRDVAHKQHKATRPVADGLTMVLRNRDPLHGAVRFCESWDMQAVDLFYRRDDGTDRHERREGADYAALVAQARKAGWTERGLYWWRE